MVVQRFDRRSVLRAGVVLGGAATFGWPGVASVGARETMLPATLPAHWATRWFRTVYDVIWAEGPTPPAAARAYAAVAIAAYEASVAGMPQHDSMAGQLTELPTMPRPRNRNATDWPTALAAAVATLSDSLFAGARESSRQLLRRTYDTVLAERRAAGIGEHRLAVSVSHGEAVGGAIADWLAGDGYAGTVGRPYTPPAGEAFWQSTPPNFGRAIEPHWAEVRPMVLRECGEVEPAPHVPFSSATGSEFWEQAMAPYRQSFANTDVERAIARFWTDNPLLSGLPSGHWMLIVAQVAEARQLDLATTLEAFARAGVALHDAFLCCWTWKYRFNLLRPVTYIRRYVDPSWSTFVNTPQFPEYTSGHSVASRAVSRVLTDLLGSFSFVDDSHRDRGMPARTHASFTAAANEAAQSRLYGGIHYPMGIAAGKDQGDAIGDLVIARLRTRHRRA